LRRLLIVTVGMALAVDLLDQAKMLKRAGNGLEWVSRRGRLGRWSTDTIRLRRPAAGVLMTGRLIDLQIMAHKLTG
jgi:hypothetical protein